MTDLRKSVLITGCSPGGIGNQLAREFHARGTLLLILASCSSHTESIGLRVFATARSAGKIGDLAALGIETLALEVTSQESIKSVMDSLEKRLPRGLDFLVNNAGRNYTVPAMEVDFDEVKDVFATNTIAVMMMCRTMLPLLLVAQGTIVQIGSVAALM
jgi:1-acylglycerone phosphate reductase